MPCKKQAEEAEQIFYRKEKAIQSTSPHKLSPEAMEAADGAAESSKALRKKITIF